MFLPAKALSFFLVVLSYGISLLYWGRLTLQDQKVYQKMEEKNPSNPIFSQATEQKRKGITKDIWIVQEDHTRLCYHMESAASTLRFSPHHSQIEIVEKLSQPRCWMQDRLYEANGEEQIVRFLEAEEGTYYYQRQQFVVGEVLLSFFRLPGHTLPFPLSPEKAFLKGSAQNASFTFSGKNPQFHAQNFKATWQALEKN